MRKTSSIINFFELLYNTLSNNYNLLDDSPSITQNHPKFIENRHDQSIFSIMLKQFYNNKYVLDNICEFTHNNINKTDAPIIASRLR
jgi:hypothetical protein